MHEVSLNQVITDYLSGHEIDLTTYEDIRQAIAKLLVEEKHYPPENIKSKYELELDLDGNKYTIIIDFVVYYEGRPILILSFCPGAVSTFITQNLCLARIFPGHAVPFVIVTDSKDAALMNVAQKKELCRGYHCIPYWDDLINLAKDAKPITISDERKDKDKRVAYAMFALSDSCCSTQCPTDEL